jgi:hypothetical protein
VIETRRTFLAGLSVTLLRRPQAAGLLDAVTGLPVAQPIAEGVPGAAFPGTIAGSGWRSGTDRVAGFEGFAGFDRPGTHAIANSSAPSGVSEVLIFASIAGGIVGYFAIVARAKQMCSAQCVGIRMAVAYSGWHGALHRFEIASEQYALQFMVANRQKLVNVPPQTWEWLKANGHVPLPNQPQSARRHMT